MESQKNKKGILLIGRPNEKRVQFCEEILKRKINYDNIMFTDECKVNLTSYTNDWIRLEPEMQNKLKNEEKEPYELINSPMKK